MLVLSRKVGERIQLGDNITVTLVKVSGNLVRLGIEAPASMPVVRQELLDRREAARSQGGGTTQLRPLTA
jgi:carbon storage regulator